MGLRLPESMLARARTIARGLVLVTPTVDVNEKLALAYATFAIVGLVSAGWLHFR